MIGFGAGQTVAARALLQSGFEYPLFLSLLYHAGQSLSLITYVAIPKSWQQMDVINDDEDDNGDDTNQSSSFDVEAGVVHNCRGAGIIEVGRRRSSYIGSRHGLGPNSEDAARWVHRIPKFWMPIISGFFSLTNNALRWASLLFVAASVAEMINSGLELVLSVLAARYLRKRVVSSSRWAGVCIVTVGVILVGLANLLSASNGEQTTSGASVRDQAIGIALIVGQSILSVLQDISQEFFLQEAQFPPLLMLGLLGLSALSIALIVYFPLASVLGQGPPAILNEFTSNPQLIAFFVGFVVLNTITDSFNILAITRTSAMTRVLWRNLRTCLVWMMGLIIFYLSGNPNLGENWDIPTSFYTLGAFA
eukprot:CAMPEP_0197725972 /NCGR_PEP_ID=MMETSP1434-20131217/12376_1 /TAXON_ID=265543 /ORGANISM="Minutocellus polymorphus, Strain CCMP3303" /LENGTH=363 /DNA_ID=CAMNT_0043311731 /DNA_START=337 /DNA_END=1425 /DNA_ORIENTATION=-